MNNDEKVLKAIEGINTRLDQQGKTLEALQADVSTLKTDVKDVKQGQTRLETRMSGVEQGQARLEKIVEPVYNRLNSVDQGLKRVEQTQAQTNTALNVIGAGHQDLTKRVKTIQEKTATKEDVEATIEAAKLELKAEILISRSLHGKKIQEHERRIENLEENTHTPNPTKY
jgi:chromosome segregation ATPase